jgi:hypothetical protein
MKEIAGGPSNWANGRFASTRTTVCAGNIGGNVWAQPDACSDRKQKQNNAEKLEGGT